MHLFYLYVFYFYAFEQASTKGLMQRRKRAEQVVETCRGKVVRATDRRGKEANLSRVSAAFGGAGAAGMATY